MNVSEDPAASTFRAEFLRRICRRTLNIDSRFRSNAKLCGICGKQIDGGANVSLGALVFRCQYISTNAPQTYSFINPSNSQRRWITHAHTQAHTHTHTHTLTFIVTGKKVKFTPEEATKAKRDSRWGSVVNATPRPLYPRKSDPESIGQEAGWAPWPVWTGAENLAPTGIRSPDRPTSKESLYSLLYSCILTY